MGKAKAKTKGRGAPDVTLPAGVEELLDRPQVIKAIHCGERKFWQMLGAGEFPRADIRMGRLLRWRKSTVNGWIEREAVQEAAKGR